MGYCYKCGKELPEGALFCPVCGSQQPITFDGQFVNSPVAGAENAVPGQQMQPDPNASGTQPNPNAVGTSGQMQETIYGQYQAYGTPQREQMNQAGNVAYTGNQPYTENPQYTDPSQFNAGSFSDHAQFSGTQSVSNPAAPNPPKPGKPMDVYAYIAIVVMGILSLIDWFSDPPIVTILLSLIIAGIGLFYLLRKYVGKGVGPAFMTFAGICIIAALSQTAEYGMFTMPPSEEQQVADDVVDTYPSDEKEETRQMASDSETGQKEEKSDPYTSSTDASDETGRSTENPSGGSRASSDTASGEEKTGLNPELKAFLDSYEAFMDEYVDFMKRYSSDPMNAASMMDQYSNIMKKYYEFAEKAEQYDSQEMSKEDAAYYLDTMTRIEKKMLEVYY